MCLPFFLEFELPERGGQDSGLCVDLGGLSLSLLREPFRIQVKESGFSVRLKICEGYNSKTSLEFLIFLFIGIGVD